MRQPVILRCPRITADEWDEIKADALVRAAVVLDDAVGDLVER